MKKLPLILSSVALLGVAILFVLHFTSKSDNSEQNSANSVAKSTGDLTIAYVLTDSVLVNYQMALDLNNDFVEKQKQYNADFSKKRTDLETQAQAFQEKLQRGGFLTEDRAVKERDRLLAQEQEMKQMDYELSGKLNEMEKKINMQLVDSIVNYVKVFNEKKKYNYIFSNSGNIIIGDQAHNISKEIVEGLNARYIKAKK
ncbi:MAG: OmpH family outer membrane protein [Prolixibacteraceae bacterium]